MTEASNSSQRVYRLDKFIVPNQARQEFLAKIESIHAVLRLQPGFIQDFLLEQTIASGEINLVTLVEWQDLAAIENARLAVMAMHKSLGFNVQEMLTRLGIKAELGNYKNIDA